MCPNSFTYSCRKLFLKIIGRGNNWSLKRTNEAAQLLFPTERSSKVVVFVTETIKANNGLDSFIRKNSIPP